MIDWTTFPVRDGLTALALIVAGLSLYISWGTAQRAKAEKSVNAWIGLARINTEWFLATLYVKNASHLGIDIEKLGVSGPDFHLGNAAQLKTITAADGTQTGLDPSAAEHYLAMSFKVNVPVGEALEKQFLLHQPAHSQRRATKVTMMYQTLEPKKRWVLLPISVRTRNDL